MDIEEVVAREQIRSLVIEYNSQADRGRFEPTLALFAQDATMVTAFGRYEGIDELRSLFTTAQGDATSEPPTRGRPHVRHMTGTHHIELTGPTLATGRLYFAVFTHIGLDHWGHYIDGYTVEDGRWRFASRVVRVDGQSDGSVFPDAIEQP